MQPDIATAAPFVAATLRVDDVSHSYGALWALRNVTLEAPAGTVCAILGPNGAGKSTLASAVTGGVKPSAGTVLLDGEDVTSLPRHARARRGLAFVPEGGALFPGLTVAEKLVIGDRRASRQERTEILKRAVSLFPFLANRWNDHAGMLSGGEQQMVSLSRVLALDRRADEVTLSDIEEAYELDAAGIATPAVVDTDLAGGNGPTSSPSSHGPGPRSV